jgi:DNA-binding CsgD family transcriptional regulator
MTTPLTARELDVVRLVAQGLQDKEIGRALGISSITVRNHLAIARQKTYTRNRTELALYAINNKIAAAPELRVGLFAEASR